MTTTVKLALANAEVNRLFTRKLPDGTRFYDAMMQKIAVLSTRAHEQQAYALLALHHIQLSIQSTINAFDDALDKYEGVLEKKKQVRGKAFTFEPRFHPTVSFSNRIAADLVTLYELCDKLISTLKLLRAAGCFTNDDDYFNQARRYFKAVNQLLSQIVLTQVKTLPTITYADVIDNADDYQKIVPLQGGIDCGWLYRAMTSNLAPRLHEAVRQPLLSRLKQRLELQLDPIKPFHEAH